MTNGELFFKTFPCLEQYEQWPSLLWWTDEKGKRQLLGDVYDSNFWDEEYKEPTSRNCLGCKYSKDNHNSGTEECHLCMWENQYTPIPKNDLGVDCVSRQAVLDLIADYDLSMGQVVKGIHALPSVTPIRPKGHWISKWYAGHDLHFHVCSECNEEFSCDMETGISIDNYRYCPKCGAEMERED